MAVSSCLFPEARLPDLASKAPSFRPEATGLCSGPTDLACSTFGSCYRPMTEKRFTFRNLESRRPEIKEYANERYSWKVVARNCLRASGWRAQRTHPACVRNDGAEVRMAEHCGRGRRLPTDSGKIAYRVYRIL